MNDKKWPKLITRREYLKLMGLIGTGALLNACGGGAAPSAEEPAAAAPTATSAPAEAATSAPIEAPTQVPTATAPAATEVPLWGDAVELRQQVHWSAQRFNDFKALSDQWNLGPGKDANIYIHTERHGATGSEAEWAAFYMADYVAGTSPDIYHLSGGLLPDLQAQGVVVAPNDEIQQYIKDNYAPGAVEYVTVDGASYGYPTELQAGVTWINTTHMTEARLETDPAKQPKSWAELREQAKALTVYEGDKKTRGGFIWHDGEPETQFINRVIMHAAEGETYIDLDNLKSNANSEIGQSIMKNWYDLIHTDDASTVGLVNIWDAYQNGLGSIIQIDAWFAKFYIVENGGQELLDQTMVYLLPTSTGQNFKSEARIYLFAVTSVSKQPAEAWQFLRWLNEAPDIHMMHFMVDQFGFLPGHKGLDMPEFFPSEMAATFQEALDVSVPMPFAKGLFEMYEATGSLQDAMAFGEKGWEEASKELEDAINTILKEKYG
jgi:ABC-type glycerol-3-phosphate transport system substrate-binding protein